MYANMYTYYSRHKSEFLSLQYNHVSHSLSCYVLMEKRSSVQLYLAIINIYKKKGIQTKFIRQQEHKIE